MPHTESFVSCKLICMYDFFFNQKSPSPDLRLHEHGPDRVAVAAVKTSMEMRTTSKGRGCVLFSTSQSILLHVSPITFIFIKRELSCEPCPSPPSSRGNISTQLSRPLASQVNRKHRDKIRLLDCKTPEH